MSISLLIKISIESSIFTIICIIVSLSSKDPLDSHIIGNITNYFDYIPNIISFENLCECNNEILNYSCTEENILQGCSNASSKIIEYKHLFKRRLKSKSFCEDMQLSFVRNEGKKLSYIFSLNYTIIRRLSITILVITLSFIGLYIILAIFLKLVNNIEYELIISEIKDEKISDNSDEKKIDNIERKTIDVINSKEASKKQIEDKRNKLRIYKIIIKVAKVLIALLWIAKIVLSLLLYHFIDSGDNKKYEDFLDCKRIDEEYFDGFKGIKKLRVCFTSFAVLSIVSESFDKLKDVIDILKS